MGRRPRKECESGIYHVIVRGNNRKELFHDDEDFRKWLELMREAQGKFEVEIFHYCLMTNHVHAITRSGSLKILSGYMHRMERSYYHYYRKRYTWFGHIFQGRYRSLAIEKDEYLLECGRYIERNPVRAGMVYGPEEWPYSSYGCYAFGKGNPLVTISPSYLGLSEKSQIRQKIYQDRVSQSRPYEEILDKELVGK